MTNWQIVESADLIVELEDKGHHEGAFIEFNKKNFTVSVSICNDGYSSSIEINVVELLLKLGLGCGATAELIDASNAYSAEKQQEQVENVRKNALAKLTEEEKQALGF